MHSVRGLGRGVFGFRTEVLGAEFLPQDAAGLPAGGWIAAGGPPERGQPPRHDRRADASAHLAMELPAGATKRWRWLTTAWH
jgi:hypothetical protein